ncbi:hypothetical protein [Natronobeatus ordinarius]|uniref:hypothetical protein n=1 Tax=Natronobeatus ordinarius TaxID=2963433 RepID=UPI0020CD825D|nr:hypothetical protein [Natronobeatus ordinarius]
MSNARDDVGSLGRLAIQGSRLEQLRDRMAAFVADHEEPDDLKTLRERTAGETTLTELVDEERNGRFE